PGPLGCRAGVEQNPGNTDPALVTSVGWSNERLPIATAVATVSPASRGFLMRRILLASLLTACASAAFADATPKEQLLVPPADAQHFVIVSTAGKHGDEYRWTMPDGRMAFRQSILLRGLIFEVDETMRVGADGMPTDIVIRGVTPSGDSAENFAITNG